MSDFSLGTLDQLLQIITNRGGIWDGDLIGKTERDLLMACGIVEKTENGYNILTAKAQRVVSLYINLGRKILD